MGRGRLAPFYTREHLSLGALPEVPKLVGSKAGAGNVGPGTRSPPIAPSDCQALGRADGRSTENA